MQSSNSFQRAVMRSSDENRLGAQCRGVDYFVESVISYVLSAAYIPIYERSSIYRFLSAADHNSHARRE